MKDTVNTPEDEFTDCACTMIDVGSNSPIGYPSNQCKSCNGHGVIPRSDILKKLDAVYVVPEGLWTEADWTGRGVKYIRADLVQDIVAGQMGHVDQPWWKRHGALCRVMAALQ